MTAPTLRPLTLGEVLDVSFGLYRSAFAPLFLVAAVTQTIPAILTIVTYDASGANLGAKFLINLLTWILSYFGVAASTNIISGAYLGHPVAAGEALRRATTFLGTLFAASLMSGLVIGFSLLLLIIPGLIAFAGLSMVTVVVVLEKPIGASAAMSRSWALTRGYRMKILGAIFVSLFLLGLVPGIAAGVFLLAGPAISPLVALGAVAILQMFFSPFYYTLLAVLYYDLRVRKEGLDLEILAAAAQPA